MAAGGFREFVAGEILTEDLINDYLLQGVLVFAGTAARGSAITSPVEGQFAWLNDSDSLTYYSGTAWEELSTTPGPAVVSGTTGSPTVGTVSSGGTVFNVYSFTGDGSITISEAGFAEVLVIGGGGGGAQADFGGGVFRGAGGGGAGAYVARSALFISAGTATITVGAGGAGSTANNIDGSRGLTSLLGTFAWAIGGGGGGAGPAGGKGADGGSGGGQQTADTAQAGPGVAIVSGQGNAGGNAFVVNTSNAAGGGGGGANAAGGNASSNQGGTGGAGISSSITGTSVGRGGGGGGASGNNVYGTASDGGGSGANGTANTGGGGSGRRTTGFNGGSGVVIVRVAV